MGRHILPMQLLQYDYTHLKKLCTLTTRQCTSQTAASTAISAPSTGSSSCGTTPQNSGPNDTFTTVSSGTCGYASLNTLNWTYAAVALCLCTLNDPAATLSGTAAVQHTLREYHWGPGRPLFTRIVTGVRLLETLCMCTLVGCVEMPMGTAPAWCWSSGAARPGSCTWNVSVFASAGETRSRHQRKKSIASASEASAGV